MAEQAAGAVSSLLSIIRSEAQLLSGVGDDMRSIKEEMESMNSFLDYLARTVPPDREHDEQVRTWMNQVRHLALDCNSCLDIYLYRSSPEILLARGRFGRYLCWLPWFLRKMVARHSVATQLRQLKDRAREVSERRCRYTVEAPAVPRLAAGQSSTMMTLAAATSGGGGDDDEEEDTSDHHQHVAAARGGGLFEPPPLDDYLNKKLVDWIRCQVDIRSAGSMPSIAVVAADTEDTSVIAREVLAAAAAIHHFKLTLFVDIPAVHLDNQPVRPKDILFYILWGLQQEYAMSRSQQHMQQQGTGDGGIIIVTEPFQTIMITEEEREEEDNVGRQEAIRRRKADIFREKMKKVHESKAYIETGAEVIIDDMFARIINDINQITCEEKLYHLLSQLERILDPLDEDCRIIDQDLTVLLLLLYHSSAAAAVAEQGHVHKKFMPSRLAGWYEENMMPPRVAGWYEEIMMPRLAGWYEQIIKITALRLKYRIDETPRQTLLRRLHETQYAHILQEVFPRTSSSKPLQDQDTNNQATTTTKGTSTTTSMGEDQIRKIIHKVLQEMQEDISVKKKPSTLSDRIMPAATEKNEEIQGTTTKETMKKTEEIQDDTTIEEQITKKIEEIKRKIKKQLKIEDMLDSIQKYLYSRSILIILRIDHNWIFKWEKARKALSMLGGDMCAVIVTTTNNTQQAEEYCYPPQKPIDYSRVGLYHDLQLTSQHKNDDDIYFSPQMIRDILVQCEPHEFCMKIFAHAIYSKPKRSNDELRELLDTLTAVSPKSLGNIAKKMLQFSFSDLSKEYKSCLLYLAIFPQGYIIRRSTLIGRWVAEGLITSRGDWPTSVRQAKRCFEALVDRWLVYPASIGATGKVKSCKVGELVHRFIKKIARRQGILETHLSDHLARHFSIFNDIQLSRRNDRIEHFLRMLSKSSQLSMLKVLDLEGCRCFSWKERHYLKEICSKILLLKYLSLRKTDVTYLPFEINNLRELEVLDIRQTKIPLSSTIDLCLLKLKRLLAGHMDPNYSSTYIPEKVEKMDGMEVLSGVRPRTSQELRDIGKLWHLRKLGVVIEDKITHLKALIQAISNLHECIQSLSITLVPKTKYTPSKERLLPPTNSGSRLLRYRPKFLESLNISGSTNKVNLLDELFLDNEDSQLTKITLSNTALSEDDLVVLSKLPMLRCVKLRCSSYAENKITFNNDEFKNLEYFLIEGSNMTEIIFDHGATELKKMVLPLSDGLNLSGLDKLQRLEELELNDNNNKGNKITSSNNNNDINNSGSIITATVAANPTNDTTTVAAHIAAAAAVTLNTNSTEATTHTTDATVADAAATTAAVAAANASATATATGIDTIAATTTDTASAVTTATTVTTASTPAPTDSNIIKNNMLRSLFGNAKGITKVTLRGTMLKQDGLQILATKPNIRCLVLLDKSYDESQLTFGKKDFPKLNLLSVECSNVTKISFAPGSCPKLEKFIWTFNFTNMELLTGIGNLLRLKEVEFNGEFVHDEVKEEIKKHKNKPYFTHYKPEKNTTY